MNLLLNILWILTGGLWMAAAWVIAGILLALTIIGLPWARAAFNIAGYTLLPFGYRVVRNEDGALLAHGWTEHCFMNPAGKPVRPPATLVAMLERAPRAAPVVEALGT